jgi:hypothetical protein
MRDAIVFPCLVACCLWFGIAREEERPGQVCVALIGALVFGAAMYW